MNETDGRKILVVDGNSEYLSVIESRLSARGYSVVIAETSEIALGVLKNENFDLILLDSKLGKVGNEELSSIVRKDFSSYFTPVVMMAEKEEIAKLITGMERGFDDFIIKPFDPLQLQLRVAMNILRVEERVHANPLTKLPGNIGIEKTIKENIASDMSFAVCYLDLNNFKSFNDIYGYDKGDDVIRQTSLLIVKTLAKYDHEGISFVGHVGGDDFIVVTDPKSEQDFANEMISEFDRIMPHYYSEEDRKRGFITVKNRRGKLEKFPLMGISIASVTNMNRKFQSPGEIAQVASEVKKFLKTQPGSSYLRDRREGQLDQLDEAVDILENAAVKAENRGEEIEPLGQVLLAAGLVTKEKLDEALKKHFSTGRRLGEVLISMNLVKSEDVGKMLERRLNVPYVSLENKEIEHSVRRIFTQEFVRTHRVMPVRLKDSKLSVAMVDPFDIKVVDDIEKITAYKVVPLLALENEFEKFLEEHYQQD